MITAEQVRAARALLNWKQSDLARASGLSLPSINNVERHVGSPRVETLEAIHTALRSAGIAFIGQQGVTRHSEVFEITEFLGDDFLIRMNDDLFSCMQGPADEVVMLGLDERKFPEYSSAETLRYDDHQMKTGFTQRILVRENDMYFLTHTDCYRWISPELLGKIPYMVYKDRIALIMWESKRGILIRSQSIASTFYKHFDFLWDLASPLPLDAINQMANPAFRANLQKKRTIKH